MAVAATILFAAIASPAFAQNETVTESMTTNKSASKPIAMNVDDFVVDQNTLIGAGFHGDRLSILPKWGHLLSVVAWLPNDKWGL